MDRKNIEEILKRLGSEDVPAQVQAIAEEASEKFSKNLMPSRQHILWRVIMESRIVRLAAAAVIIIAVLVGIHHFSGSIDGASVAWADVVKPILNAKTASLDILIGSGNNKSLIHDEVMGSRIRRTVPNIKHEDIIIDLEQRKLMTLDHGKKTVVYIELSGLGEIKNYLEILRNSVIRLQNDPDFRVEGRGIEEFRGQDYIVFVAEGKEQTITIWTNPDTAMPVRIEQKTPNMQIVCDNIKFDIELDKSQFSMEVPENYAVQEAGKVDFKKVSEADFIESLRIWAEIIEDGHFPDSINLGDIVKIGPKIDQAFKRANLTEQQETEIALRWGQGLVFIRLFKGQGQWHYAGKGVELGDGNTPIFWYQPKESQTWRVIYGDLHVEDVAEEDLPQ